MTAPAPTWQPLAQLLRDVVDPRDSAGPGVSLLELLDARPDWHDHAACADDDVPLDLFFPGRGESTAPARAVCADCPVRLECRSYAVELADAPVGIWGGTSARERRPLRRAVASSNRRRERVSAPPATAERLCGGCGAPFDATPGQRYCDTRCRRRAAYLRRGY